MRLTKAEIFGYGSIGACELQLDSELTVLVGKSESGKTFVLKALSRFSEGGPLTTEERCSWTLHQPPETPFVRTTWRLTDEDRAELAQLNDAFETLELVVERLIDGSHRLVSPSTPRKEVAQPPENLANLLTQVRRRGYALANDLDLMLRNPSAAGADPETTTLLRELVQGLRRRTNLRLQGSQEAVQAEIEPYLALLDQIGKIVNAPPLTRNRTLQGARTRVTRMCKTLREISSLPWTVTQTTAFDLVDLLKKMPRITVLRDEAFLRMPDQVSLEKLGTGDGDATAATELLAMADLSADDLQASQGYLLTQRLRTGEKLATQRFRNLWGQESIEVQFSVTDGSFSVYFVGDERHTGPPSHHSEGFQWFLGFALGHLRNGHRPSGEVLLFDEPGLHLHAGAQTDLVRFLERLAKDTQLVYVTHSPFMISKNHPRRVRAVLKSPDAHRRGTTVVQHPYTVKSSRSWEPIRSSIGLSAGMSPFLSAACLIVEGITDQMLITAAAQRVAEEHPASVSLDLDRASIAFAGGADGTVTLATFCRAEGMDCCVLLDNDPSGCAAQKQLLASDFPESHVMTVDQLFDETAGLSDIESLIDESIYFDAVRNFYTTELLHHPAAETFPADLVAFREQLQQKRNEPEAPLVKTSAGSRSKEYEEFFARMEWGAFAKVPVTQDIAERLRTEEDLGATQQRFTELVQALGARLKPSIESED